MIKTDKGRYEEALKYLQKYDVNLGQSVRKWTLGREKEVGEKIGLGGDSWDKDDEKRAATRAILLCVIAFFGGPHNGDDTIALPYYLSESRNKCKVQSRKDVVDELKCYQTLPNVTLESLANAAEHVKSLTTIEFMPWRLRTDKNLGPSPICYDGVFNWLFAAGFISRQWFGKHGSKIHASTIQNALGNGVEVPVGEWGNIPRGYIWNIHKTTDRATCHWGVSLGGGKAAACNNTSQGKVKYEEGGGDSYGQFVFTDLCAVLETTEKYAGLNQSVDKTYESGDRKGGNLVSKPLGSYITVRKYSPLAGGPGGIYV